MAKFTVRVELHKASGEEYQELHEAMEAAGFSRTIKSGDGIVYHLPTAEYRYSSDTESASDVCDRAANVAKEVKASPAVLVTQASATSWRGLSKAK